MVCRLRYFATLAFAVVILMACTNTAEKEFIRKQSFNEGWEFHYGDLPENPSGKGSDAAWRPGCNASLLDLPHDWSIEMPFAGSEGGIAIGQTQGGVAWYRKSFKLPAKDVADRHLLYFEGVYMESEVWINDQQVSFQPYGYTSFFCDITDYCRPAGEENIVAVKVKNEGRNSRWYAGSGIYRPVWLVSTANLHLDEWGVFITTQILSGDRAKVNLTVDVWNESAEEQKSAVTIIIKDQSNQIVAEQKMQVEVEAVEETKTVHPSIEILKPQRWSVDSPVLYTADIRLEVEGKLKDRLSVPFGIREISFSAQDGFLLNGQALKLKGGCVHHDNGLLGAVALDRAEERKVELLKANGFNAVRCAHNPPSEKFLEACDRLGLLVIDEAFDQWQKQKTPQDYHRFFDEWYEKDLSAMVLRDRNHPSIIMWSIGNEIQERSDSSGVEIVRKLKSIVHKYDHTRPVTAAINDYWDNPNLKWSDSPAAFASLDVCGYNYMWWEYENDTKRHPERIIYGSETTAMERAVNWDLVEKHPAIIGDFIWTAIDYLGESGIGHALNVKDGEKDPPQFLDWPWFNAWCGDIDICGNKKPQAALRDVLWRESPITMLVHRPVPEGYKEKVSYWGWPDEEAHWNWSGYEGKDMDVKVYTRYSSVRLYMNGNLLAEKKTEEDRIHKYSAGFKVKYQQGELKAVGVDGDTEQESTLLVTTGSPAGIRLVADRTELKNTKNDLSYVQIELIDRQGNIVPDADVKLDLSILGNGKILAVGNACPTDMESFRSPITPKTYKGSALAILQPLEDKGGMELRVKAQDYEEQMLTITTN